MDIDKLIYTFNLGDFEEDIEPYFNDLMTFLKFIKKYGLLNKLNLSRIADTDIDHEIWDFLVENNVIKNLNYDDIPMEFKNFYLLDGLENNYEDTITYITEDLLTDVEIRDGGFYLYLSDREELSNFFCDGSRNYMGASSIAKIVFGEDGHEWYYNEYTKPSEVIEILDDSNITRLKDIIYKEIGDKELSLEYYNTDFFEFLSEEQGTEGYFRIRPEDLNGLLDDSESINKLCNDDLSDLGSELSSLYSNSENTAYEDELYSLVYDGLSEYFEGNILEEPKKIGQKTRYVVLIKIRDFVGNISTFLNEYKASAYNDSVLEYYGSYTDMMKHLIYDDVFECIDFRAPEYPDYRRTVKNVNEYFTDYI